MHPIKDATGRTYDDLMSDPISIHAPYKGCNETKKLMDSVFGISIHAPYKGCNVDIISCKPDDFDFNPCTL